MGDSSNPLLDIEFPVAFDNVRAEQVVPAVEALLGRSREQLARIVSQFAPRSYADTMEPLDNLTVRLDRALAVIRHLEAVATTPALREAYNAIQAPVSRFRSELFHSEGLWKALGDYAASDEAGRLMGSRRRYLEKTLADFRREGAALPLDQKERLASIDVALSETTTRFAQNLLDATHAFDLIVTDERELAGLPESALATARSDAQAKGKEGWRLTLQAPCFIPAMTYLESRSLRERLYHAHHTRAREENRPLIEKILQLRGERAHVLGFSNFADLVLDDRMAKNGRQALLFVRDLRDRSLRQFEKENAELAEFARSEGGPAELAPWDLAFWSERQRRAQYAFDEEQLRPYFPLERAISGMFDVVARLYGIAIEPTARLPVWHESVRAYEVRDEGGTRLGAFYLDLFPRETKRDGAWMGELIGGGPTPDGFAPHLGTICANLSPPVGDAPALLTHREVETLFHEFGHLLHLVLSRVEVRSLAGTDVAWDFVELPSQIMENWCWERSALDLFARHHKSGQAIPDDLFDKMRRARNFRSAGAMMRQLGFAILDLTLHTDYRPARDGDVLAYARAILQDFTPAPLPEDYAMLAGFNHLFAHPVGYGAGYYSYKWAEVLDADAFTRFQQGGVFSRQVGTEFRGKILARGNSADPMALFEDFMGRPPDPEALLRRSGLAAEG